MSAPTYRDAMKRFRAVLDLIGPFAGPCSCCGWLDSRHRVADAISSRVIAGDDPGEVAEDYVDGGGAELAHRVTIAVLDADIYRHRVAVDAAARIDQEVWAEAH